MSHGGRRKGAGQKRSCFCNRFGCMRCMQVFIQAEYARRKKERAKLATKNEVPLRDRRYDWDRTQPGQRL